ncbi:MAG: sugar phosphate nucleotidyltransferase [Acidimicrobiales bacterium]
MRTVILCGGKGTRAYPYTTDLPKPLLEVADRPVLEHVMAIYADQGHRDFILAAGFRVDLIEEFAAGLSSEWRVEVADTGEDTNTGARLAKVRDRAGDPFFVTYGDGLGDVDLTDLLAFHASHSGAATVTTVPLPSQYGTVESDIDGRVHRFREKPSLDDRWINAGFLTISQRAFDHWVGDDLEREVLPALALAGELYAYRHGGFWKSMDTYKDALDLTALCAGGSPPWRH